MTRALALVALAAALAGCASEDPEGEDPVAAPATERRSTGSGAAGAIPERAGTACERLAQLGSRLASEHSDPAPFLRTLGREAAGIRPGDRTLADLARGGEDRIPGGGFKPEFDDGSDGQVRHFAGVALAASLGGGAVTRWLNENLRRDPPGSADARLSDEATEFARLLARGELPLDRAPRWLLDHLCVE